VDTLDPQRILFGDYVGDLGRIAEPTDGLIRGSFFEDYKGWSGTREWAIRRSQLPKQIKPSPTKPALKVPMVALDSSMVHGAITLLDEIEQGQTTRMTPEHASMALQLIYGAEEISFTSASGLNRISLPLLEAVEGLLDMNTTWVHLNAGDWLLLTDADADSYGFQAMIKTRPDDPYDPWRAPILV